MASVIIIPDDPPTVPETPAVFQSDSNLSISLTKDQPPLRIVCVNSGFSRRSARLRLHRPTSTAEQKRGALRCAEAQYFDEDTNPGTGPGSSGDNSDEDYNDDCNKARKRRRMGEKRTGVPKKKRHGKLALADRDLIRDAQTGLSASKPGHRKKQRLPKIAKKDAVNLISKVAERVDWKQAVAVQPGLCTTGRDVGPVGSISNGKDGTIEFEGPERANSSRTDEFQLKRYWSKLLVKSLLELDIK